MLSHDIKCNSVQEMTNKHVFVGIIQIHSRFDGESLHWLIWVKV